MEREGFARRLLVALADATSAFRPAPVTELGSRTRRVLAAMADAAPAFTPPTPTPTLAHDGAFRTSRARREASSPSSFLRGYRLGRRERSIAITGALPTTTPGQLAQEFGATRRRVVEEFGAATDAALRLDDVLVVKVDGGISVHYLSGSQQYLLTRSPELLSQPHRLLRMLDPAPPSQDENADDPEDR